MQLIDSLSKLVFQTQFRLFWAAHVVMMYKTESEEQFED